MIDIYAQNKQSLILGYQGEHRARRVIFDLSHWAEVFGEGAALLLARREGDDRPYPCAVTQEGPLVIWEVTAADVFIPGRGQCELSYLVGEQVVKSRSWNTVVQQSIGQPGPAPDAPGEHWIHQVTQSARAAEDAAKTAQDCLEKVMENTPSIPDYWQSHLEEKIAAIRQAQEAGGRDCFSFAVITDAHCESNLGKRAPALARHVMDRCGIKYCLCLGDSQTRHGARHDEAYILSEWEDIETMFAPIRDRLLMQLGNHDGAYGIFDPDGDGTADDFNGDGSVDAGDKCVYNLTPQQLYQRALRKVELIPVVVFDHSGNAFYADDRAAKVRYILLNSHCSSGEKNADGTAASGSMTHFRFGQAQYDFLVQDALATVPEGWSVIVACHVPLDRTQEYVYWGGEVDENGSLKPGSTADCTVMQRLLNAYHQKTTYSGTFGAPAPAYTNRADPESADWSAASRFDSSGSVVANSGTVVTNYIPVAPGDTVRIKGAALAAGQRFAFYGKDRNYINVLSVSGVTSGGSLSTDESTGVQTLLNVGSTTPDGATLDALAGFAWVRFVLTVEEGAQPVITVNEEIAAAPDSEANRWDFVSVEADFTQARGELVGLFAGHTHADCYWRPGLIYNGWEDSTFGIFTTRCDARAENSDDLYAERAAGTVTEQSFDVFTVNRAARTVSAVKIGAGSDRSFSY